MISVLILVLFLPFAWSKSCANLCGTNNAYSITLDISCQCDVFCEQIGDCCEDYWEECAKVSQNKIINPTISCQRFNFRSEANLYDIHHMGVYMVTSCSEEYKISPIFAEEIIQKCEVASNVTKMTMSTKSSDLHLITPVIIENVTYVNIFCAICNEVVADNIQHWNLIYVEFERGAPIEMIRTPSYFNNNFLYRFPHQNHSIMYTVNGQSRLSKYCFTEVKRTCPTISCTPFICTELPQTGCEECKEEGLVRNGCAANFSALEFFTVAKPKLDRGFFFDLTIIFDDGNFIFNAVSSRMGINEEIHRENCSQEERQGNGTCFSSILDCLEISCTPAIKEEPSSMHATILTLVGLSISLISLIATLIICWKTESFQAKIVRLQIQCFIAHIGAILSFLIAGSVSMRESADWLCKAAAVVMHFSFLAMFSWMHVIAWSVFMMIVGTKRFLDQMVIQSPKWVESAAHYALGWCSPVIIVLVSITLEYFCSPGYLGYGKNGRCWINEQQGILNLFLIPSGLSLALNIFLAIATVALLISIISQQPNVANTISGKTIVYLLIRVSIAVGLEWSFGIVCYFIPDSIFIRYTFIIFVSFHGFWILISTLTLGGMRDKWLPGCISTVSNGRKLLSSWWTSTESRPSAEVTDNAEARQNDEAETTDSSSCNVNSLHQEVERPKGQTSTASQPMSHALYSDSIREARRWTSSSKAIKTMCSSTTSAGPSVNIKEKRDKVIDIAEEKNAETNFCSMDGTIDDRDGMDAGQLHDSKEVSEEGK